MSEFNNQTQLKIPKEISVPRHVEKSDLTIKEAKAICEANGVVWDVKEMIL